MKKPQLNPHTQNVLQLCPKSTCKKQSDDWFVRETGMSSTDIIKNIRRLIKYSGIKVHEEDWNSYEKMNYKICSLLELN